MSALRRIRWWLWRLLAPADYIQLDVVGARLLDDYRAAVARGASAKVLGGILTGLAGCELAMSYTVSDAPDGEPGLGEQMRLSGLLLQEMAHCATEARKYLGVRSRELDAPEIVEALRQLALAYADDTAIGVTLAGVQIGALLATVSGLVYEADAYLVPLMAAHGTEPDWAGENDE